MNVGLPDAERAQGAERAQSAAGRGGLFAGTFILDTQSRREVYAYGLSRATAASAAVTQARSAESSAEFRTHGLITESGLIV